MSDPNADFKTLLDLTGGVQVRSAEHPDDRRQRHRLEVNAIRLIGPIPDKRVDWAAGVLQLVLGGAVGFALKRSA